MKKLLSGMILFLFAAPLFATQSRLGGLGIDSWMIEEDDSLIWLNPQKIADYPKVLWGELGTATGSGVAPRVDNNLTFAQRWGGISGYCPIVDGAILGFFLNRPYGGLVGSAGADPAASAATAIPADPFGNPLTALIPQTKFEIFYALPNPVTVFKKKLNLGFRLGYASNYTKNDTTSQLTPPAGSATEGDELNSSDLVLVFGGKMKDISLISDLDLALSFGMPSVQNSYRKTFNTGTAWITADDQSLGLNSKFDLGFTARAVIPVRRAPLLAYFNYASNDVSNTFSRTKDTNLNGSFNDPAAGDLNYTQDRGQKRTVLTLGGSYNIQTSPKTLLIVAANLNRTVTTNNISTRQLFSGRSGMSEISDNDVTSLSIPANFAVEHILSRIITARIGVSQNLYQMTTTNTSNSLSAWDAASASYQRTSLASSTSKAQNTGATTLSLGAGIAVFKGLALDAVVRQQVLFSGTYLVSGVPETVISQISALYRF